MPMDPILSIHKLKKYQKHINLRAYAVGRKQDNPPPSLKAGCCYELRPTKSGETDQGLYSAWSNKMPLSIDTQTLKTAKQKPKLITPLRSQKQPRCIQAP